MTTIDTTTEILDQLADDTARARSVVKSTYKLRYAERALTAKGKAGVAKKVLAQSCGDWLAKELAALVRPNAKKPMDIVRFEEICAANGVDTSTLPHNTKGWQGRVAMNGRQMLRAAIAEADGEFVVPGVGTLTAPRSWVVANTH